MHISDFFANFVPDFENEPVLGQITNKNLKIMAENKNGKNEIKMENLRYYFELQYGKEDNFEYLRSKMYVSKVDCLKAMINKYDQEKNKGYIAGRLTDTFTGEVFEI